MSVESYLLKELTDKVLQEIIKIRKKEHLCTKTRCQNIAKYGIICPSPLGSGFYVGECCEEHIDEAQENDYRIFEVYLHEGDQTRRMRL